MKKQIEHSPMALEADISSLHQLFLDDMKDIYCAKIHLIKSLPNIAKYATSDDLKELIYAHLSETICHIERVEMILEDLGEKVDERNCEAMEGLIAETNKRIRETEGGTMARDVVIIACLQKIEHYEIATYGTLHAVAQILNHNEIAEVLHQTLVEEKNADARLTELATSEVNEQAKTEQR